MKRVSLECGGKTPNIIMADCPDLDAAATAAAWGIFFNQGEVCNAGSRLIVEESIKDQVLEKIIAVGKKLQPGDPLDPKTRMGAMVDKTQMERVLGYIEKRQEGRRQARLRAASAPATKRGGYYIEPTIFDQVENKMTIAQEEIFGPVLSTITFKTPDEAVRIGNDTIYGLAAAVWTRTSPRRTRPRAHCAPARSGSTASTTATSRRPSAATSSRASAATSRSTRSTNTRS